MKKGKLRRVRGINRSGVRKIAKIWMEIMQEKRGGM
jgi:hypothetical protein